MFKRLVSLFSAKAPAIVKYGSQSIPIKNALTSVRSNLIQELLFPFLRAPALQRVPVYVRANHNERLSRFKGFNRQDSRHYSLLSKPTLSQSILSQRYNKHNNNPIFFKNITGNLFQKLDHFVRVSSSSIPFPHISVFLSELSNSIHKSLYTAYGRFLKLFLPGFGEKKSRNDRKNKTQDINMSASSSYAKRIRDMIEDHRLPSAPTEQLGSSMNEGLGCKVQFKHYPNNKSFLMNESYLLSRDTIATISNSIDHQIRELTILKNQLAKIHSNLGMLPFTFQPEGSSIIISFPNSTVKEVELLLLDLGVTRGSVTPSSEEEVLDTPISSSPMTASSSNASSWFSCISEHEFFVDAPVVNKAI